MLYTGRRGISLALAVGLLLALSAYARADFTFVQISDTHVGTNESAFNARYREVIRQVNALKPAFVIQTGDAVQGMSPENLALYKELTEGIAAPMYTVPGNHDIPEIGKDGPGKASERIDAWRRVIGCDRVSFERDGCVFIGLDGNLWNCRYPVEKEQFDWLKSELRKARGKRIFVFQHSPLFLQTPNDPDGDYFEVARPARTELLKLFKDYHVEAVLTGHYHRAIESAFAGTTFLTTPATSFSCAADQGLTGYSVFHVYPGGFTHRFVDLRTKGAPPEFGQ